MFWTVIGKATVCSGKPYLLGKQDSVPIVQILVCLLSALEICIHVLQRPLQIDQLLQKLPLLEILSSCMYFILLTFSSI